MSGLFVRRALFALAAAVCLGCWAALIVVKLFFDPSIAVWTGFVTAAAISTEILFWVGAAALGWSLFARFSVLQRLTGRTA